MRQVKNATAALILAAASTVAAEGYVGAAAGSARYDLKDSGISFAGRDTGWKLFAGYRFSHHLGLEAAYYDFGEPDDHVRGNSLDIRADGYGGFLTGFLPAGRQFYALARLGVVHYDVTSKWGGTTASDNGQAAAWGIGAGYRFSRKFSMAAEWERIEADNGDVDLISLSGRFHFHCANNCQDR
jgi:OOP family OmpA-OmpF porin